MRRSGSGWGADRDAPGGAPRRVTLDRFLSRSGVGSRVEARAWIEAGRVRVDGRLADDAGAWIDPRRQIVQLDGKRVRQASPVTFILHKPKGYVTTRRDPEGRPTVFDLVPVEERRHLVAAGRLDRDSSGLLLLTNDTRLAHRVTDPAVGLPRTYIVKATGRLTDAQIDSLRRGVTLADGPARALGVARLREPGGKTVLSVTLDEGRNRQVRRMVAAVGGKVQRLVRVALGPLELGELPAGAVRRLIPAEIRALERATSVSETRPSARPSRRR